MRFEYREENQHSEQFEAPSLEEAERHAKALLRSGKREWEELAREHGGTIRPEAVIFRVDDNGEVDDEPCGGAAIRVDPPEPECEGDEHDWRKPQWLGGLKENPGVYGKGGGVVIREVCARCGHYRITDTWDEQLDMQLETIRYEEPDDDSRAYVARRAILDAPSLLDLQEALEEHWIDVSPELRDDVLCDLPGFGGEDIDQSLHPHVLSWDERDVLIEDEAEGYQRISREQLAELDKEEEGGP